MADRVDHASKAMESRSTPATTGVPSATQPASQQPMPENNNQQDRPRLRGGCIDKNGFCCGVWPADGCYCAVM
ncbi:hypothetical protein CSOJ01_10117 [Colletotrichum sojae]|uniref:Uncharacterized protein n=1 Tax=Colletotrichum sojae TaxID=2175907 RepID=A0A8H6J1G0_9PEZI|nr:hypothetical protein CSOJ01_10117 [Colletotrichum sojae]